MNLFRKYLLQMKAQLAALTISQKLLIGLLALVMVATIFFTVIFSAKPEMVPLTAQPMSPEDINQVEMSLKGGKYPYQISGTQVLVPAEQQYAIRGLLFSMHAMPKKASAFTDLIANSNPFTPEAQNNRAWNNALQVQLVNTLEGYPYIDEAEVFVAMGQQAGLGRSALPSTASVSVKTRGTEDVTEQQVAAIVDLITYTVSGMKRENVSLVVNGQRAYRAPSDDIPMASNLLEIKKSMEGAYTDQLFKIFSTYGDVKIAVNVMPDLSVRHNDDIIVDPKNKVVAAESEQVRESSDHDGGGAGGEPGYVPNGTVTAADTSPAGGRGGGSTSNESNTQNRVVVGQQHHDTLLPAGVEIKDLTASLFFPRSYFVSLFRRQTNDPKAEPEDAKLQPIIDQQLKSIVAMAKNAIGATQDAQVRADWYDDTIAARLPAEVVLAQKGASSGAGMVPVIAQYAKQGVLALVALGVLGMMLMMVRRAVPATDGDEDFGALAGFAGASGSAGGKGRKKGRGGVEQLEASDDVFGEANQGEAVLTGIELDDETLASRKMVDEVSVMIKENPENAAALVKRWMAKSN